MPNTTVSECSGHFASDVLRLPITAAFTQFDWLHQELGPVVG